MRNFQERGSKKFWQSWPVLSILTVLLLVFTYNVFVFGGKMQNTRNNRKLAEDKFVQLELQKEKLSNDIAKLNTEEGVEENIREKFGLVKEGEGMIVIVEDEVVEEIPEPSKLSSFFLFFKKLFR